MRAVVLAAIFVAGSLSVPGFAQEQELPQVIEFTVGCREMPSAAAPSSVAVLAAWVEENALFADIAVTNASRSDFHLPARNAGGHYWDAVLYDSQGQAIAYCGGVSELNLEPFAELIAEGDVVIVKPGKTVVLRRIALAPFWPYLREPDHDAHSFEVFYKGWSNIVVHLDAADSARLNRALEDASRRQCSLYAGELKSPRRLVPPAGH